MKESAYKKKELIKMIWNQPLDDEAKEVICCHIKEIMGEK